MKKERWKIERPQPKRYILVTSQFLSPANKDTFLSLLFPFCQGADDIIRGNKVNSLLRQHPAVEQAHYKLWLTSTAVLQKILHSDVYQQSEFLQQEIQEKLRLCVQSKAAYGKAPKPYKQRLWGK